MKNANLKKENGTAASEIKQLYCHFPDFMHTKNLFATKRNLYRLLPSDAVKNESPQL